MKEIQKYRSAEVGILVYANPKISPPLKVLVRSGEMIGCLISCGL